MKVKTNQPRWRRWFPLILLLSSSPFLIFSRGCSGNEVSWCNASYLNYIVCQEVTRGLAPATPPASTCPSGCIAGQCLTSSLYGPGSSCVTAGSESSGTCTYCVGYFGLQTAATPATSTENIAAIPTVLTVNEQFDITFTTGIVPGSLVLSGTLGNAASGVHVFTEQNVFNDTVHVLPSSSWPPGSTQPLTISAENDQGVTFTETISIQVLAPAAPPADPPPMDPILLCLLTGLCW